MMGVLCAPATATAMRMMTEITGAIHHALSDAAEEGKVMAAGLATLRVIPRLRAADGMIVVKS
jgi:hypothetical protein